MSSIFESIPKITENTSKRLIFDVLMSVIPLGEKVYLGNIKYNKKESKKQVKVAKTEKKSNKKHWFKDFKAELKKVIWPSKKELFSNTVVVLVVVIVVSLLVFILDLIFDGITTFGVKQVEKLQDNNVVNEVVEDNETSENETTTEDEQNSVNEENADTESNEGVSIEETNTNVEE